MKLIYILLLIFSTSALYSQTAFPDFLHGTWKMENKEIYEHWDILSEGKMKGFSYKMKNGKMTVSEYLDLTIQGSDIIYTASVLNQNKGAGIDFRMTQSDSLFVFENPNHDFPKKISYLKRSDTEIFVQVSDGQEKGFSYIMHKIID
ncbi:MAG: hypothetical protein IAE98_13595 [Candidatus Kapabacteria bacterium]|nr:hypothetical protein [Candidatus Kapabacteria bacterium]